MSAEASIIFVILVGVTLYITWWAGRRNTSVESHLVAKGSLSGRKNGVAIAGDFISAATFLGTTGAIAVGGFNGFYLAVYIPVAFLLALLLVAEPLRNLGQFTLGDVLATRFAGDGVRGAIAISSIVVSLLYMVAQFVGAALLIQLLFDIDYVIAALVIGALTTVYTLIGGMLATTYIQILKTCLLLFCGVLLLMVALSKFGWNPLEVFQRVDDASGGKLLQPGRLGGAAQWDQFSLIFGVTLGVLGLPHVMIRFLTVRDSSEARKSAVTAIWIFSGFLVLLPVLSYSAVLLLKGDERFAATAAAGGNMTIPLLSDHLGGEPLLAFVSAVAFATILAALAGLVIATTGSISHDIYGKLIKKGQVDHRQQLVVARVASVASTVVALLIALVVKDQNVAFLATLAIAVAASANLPALLFTMYVRGTTAAGVTWGMVAGLGSAVVLILLSPVFHPTDPDAALFPLKSPGIISVPIGFAVMFLVSLATRPRGQRRHEADARFARVRFQATTGIDPDDPRGALAGGTLTH
ncbi:cation acetate symporter [Nocardioides sp. WV_118_6]